MARIPVMAGIKEERITTDRLTTRVLFSGPADGVPVLFLHGNASSATFWEETMLALPAGYRGIAPDQRGYGGADRGRFINATRGMKDLADDAITLLNTLGIRWAHFVGHSLGGAVVWQIMMDYPDRIMTVTQAAPGSPFGFGGTKDIEGNVCWPDGAGSGGGIVNPAFTKYMAEGYRGTTDAQGSPRVVMNSFYWKPPFVPAREEELLSSLLSEHVGERGYPGDHVQSLNWPNTAPGVWGPANALAPIYADKVERLYAINPKPPVLWIRGADDQIVSDNSLFEMGTLGKLGAVPGYPGEDVYPPQPMVSQTRAVLEKYAEAGGYFQEIVFEDCGHTPYLEKPEAFNEAFHRQLRLVTA